jgi:hypothetical protein
MKTYKEEFYEYGESLGIKVNDLQRLMMLAKLSIDKDKFAIGFAEWCAKYGELNRNVYGKILYAKSKYDDVFLIEELLEIYKKEKGL